MSFGHEHSTFVWAGVRMMPLLVKVLRCLALTTEVDQNAWYLTHQPVVHGFHNSL